MTTLRRFLPLAIAFAALVPWANAQAESNEADDAESDLPPSAAFDRARAMYRSGSFEECVESYEQLFSHGVDFPEDVSAETVEQARVYFSACLLALGRGEDAEAQMSAAIDANRQMSSPDPVAFPVQVLDLFFKVRHRFLERIEEEQERDREKAAAERKHREELERRERERVAKLERLAAQETLIHQNERWIASVPFGVGQFQNGDTTLGTLFLATETLLFATTVTAVAIHLDTYSQAGGGVLVDADAFNRQNQTAYKVQLFAGAGFLLTSGLGILEAHLNFVPEHRLDTRARPVPKAAQGVDAKPAVVPTTGGAVFGVLGRF
jgi:hypothetical protein